MKALNPLREATNCCIIYCRVSSDRQVTEGNGLESQEQRCRDYARQKGWVVLRVFKEAGVSGGLLDRPEMNRMQDFLEAQKNSVYVVVDDISRWARDTAHHFTLKTALKTSGGILVLINQPIEDSPEGKFIETIHAASAELERNRNQRQVVSRMKARLLNGFWPWCKVPHGYKWSKNSVSGKILVRDEPLASQMAEVLEGFAVGRFPQQIDVQNYLQSLPLFPKGKTGQVSLDRVHSILTNVAYSGYLKYPKWEVPLTLGKHEAITSLKTFQKIQDKLNNNNRVKERKDTSEGFPLRGYVLCDCCEKPLTGSTSTGRTKRYPYYHCRNPDCVLHGKAIPPAQIESEFLEVLNDITPSKSMLELTKAIIQDVHSKKISQFHARLMDIERTIKSKQKEMDNLLDYILETSSAAIKKRCEERVERIEEEIALLREESRVTGKTDISFDGAVGTVFNFMKQPRKIWENGTLEDKRMVLRLTFAKKLRYRRGEGFGTAALSLPFSIMQGSKPHKEAMVVDGVYRERLSGGNSLFIREFTGNFCKNAAIMRESGSITTSNTKGIFLNSLKSEQGIFLAYQGI